MKRVIGSDGRVQFFGLSVEERLAMFTSVMETGCHIWTGRIYSQGYGQIYFDGRNQTAHRVAYILRFGAIPDGLVIDHLCRNRACVNPDHLEAVSNKENILRGEAPSALNLRKTHCKQGHEFTKVNTYLRSAGRMCRICHADTERRRRARAGGQ